MGTLKLTAEGLERDRKVARDERTQLARGGPIGLGLRKLYATAFPGHPYGWPASGLDADLDRITLTACEAYQRAQYSPDNAVLVVTGRFDAAQAMALVRRHFGSLPPPSAPARKPPVLAPQLAEQRGAETVEGDLPVLMAGWRAAGGADHATAALEVLSHLIGDGVGSRAGRALIAQAPPRCLAVESGFDARRDGALLYVAAVVRPGADSADVERTLLAECEKLATTPPGTPELDAAKREVELNILLDQQTPRGTGQALGMAEAVFGDYRIAAQKLQRLRELTPDDVMRAAADVLKPERRNVVWLILGRDAPGAGGRGGAR
jgi:zinc protease